MIRKLNFVIALWAGKLLAQVIGLLFPARGTNMSGVIACRLMGGFLGGFSGIDPDKTIFITGTNGKSSSNNLVAHIFRSAGRLVTTNLEGANLMTGIATTLIKNSTMWGRLKSDYLILEVDERNLAAVRALLPARFLAVVNVQKDQVQRNGDPDYIYRKVLAAIDSTVTVFANNEEPRSASLGEAGGRAVRFSVARQPRDPLVSDDAFSVTMPCPRCCDALIFNYYTVAGMGDFVCPGCGFRSDERADYRVESVSYERATCVINGVELDMKYAAAHFLYNYALGFAVAGEFGISGEAIAQACRTFRNVGGRLEDFSYGGKRIRYVRIKQENPETVQSALAEIASDPEPKVLILGLQLVHDIIPHYTNVAYAFDCDVAGLLASGVEDCVCFGSVNCYDAALRLAYAGFPSEKIHLVDSDQPQGIFEALGRCGPKRAYLVTMIGQYETMRRHADKAGAAP